MNRDDILERLDKMDMEAFVTIEDSNMYHLVIVGGRGYCHCQSILFPRC